MAAAIETPLSDACTSTKTATAAKPTTATAEEASRASESAAAEASDTASSAERASRGSGWVIPRCVERAVTSEVTMIGAVAKRISVGEVRSLIHQPG